MDLEEFAERVQAGYDEYKRREAARQAQENIAAASRERRATEGRRWAALMARCAASPTRSRPPGLPSSMWQEG
jgi:hypothetical protein